MTRRGGAGEARRGGQAGQSGRRGEERRRGEAAGRAARRGGWTGGAARRPRLEWGTGEAAPDEVDSSPASYGDMSGPVGRCPFEFIGSYHPDRSAIPHPPQLLPHLHTRYAHVAPSAWGVSFASRFEHRPRSLFSFFFRSIYLYCSRKGGRSSRTYLWYKITPSS